MDNSFCTKSETLKKLYGKLKTVKILPYVYFTVSEWKANPGKCLDKVQESNKGNKPLIIRSSALNEDSINNSNAGKYLSLQNITSEKEIINAVNKVINSYSNKDSKNQVLIQPMLKDIKLSGVAFSKDPTTGSPYIVINYDDLTGSTSTVTSGNSNKLKTFYYYKFSNVEISNELKKIVALVQELEKILKIDSLDIEFAIDKKGDLYLFQVRPLIIKDKKIINKDEHLKLVKNLYEKIKKEMQPKPNVLGNSAIYGVMPDWNPAEIIGLRPRPLALSLYKELITDNIWAYQRDNYGYRNLRSFPLLVSFYGIPFVDVRVDFNSFIPADINDALASKLVDYYLERLAKIPSYHDKVEFEIVYSCYVFDMNEKLLQLCNEGFTKKECEVISRSLRNLTNNVIHYNKGLWRKDIEKISILEHKFTQITESNLDNVSKIYWLLEDCKRYGTLPFSGLARAAFIAVQLLKSLVKLTILSKEDYEVFMLSLNTVSSQMNSDFRKLSRKEFLKKYGHLRPGTYDILSPRYDEDPGRYFDWVKKKFEKTERIPSFKLSVTQKKQISYLLKEHNLECTLDEFFGFIRSAIEGREYAKFVFTRSLSHVLSLFKELSENAGFNLNSASYADISCIKRLYSTCDDIKIILKRTIEEGKKDHKLTNQLILPPIIFTPKDVWTFHMPETEPNYVTLKRAVGSKVFHTESKSKIRKNILLVPSADPGFDWIFSHEIAGLITMYGGVNSHMAIRAGELGIPAAIGVGETIYSQLLSSDKIELDCANKLIKVLK